MSALPCFLDLAITFADGRYVGVVGPRRTDDSHLSRLTDASIDQPREVEVKGIIGVVLVVAVGRKTQAADFIQNTESLEWALANAMRWRRHRERTGPQ